jgi:hypothetical protein
VTEDPQVRRAGRRHARRPDRDTSASAWDSGGLGGSGWDSGGLGGSGSAGSGWDSGRRSRRGRGRRAAARVVLVLGVLGLAVSVLGLAVQLLPRQFTAGQQRQIESWQVASRWQAMPAGKIFPASVPYQLPATVLEDTTPLNLDALRVGIAPQQSDCAKSMTSAAAGAVLGRAGCEAVLRATYVDSTRSYVMTVGVAVLPTATAASSADTRLTGPLLAAARNADGATRLGAGVQVVRFPGMAGELYDYNRQISASFSDGPYIVMYAVGYSDRRPRVPVSQDSYAYGEMTSMATGVAKSVAATLGTRPASPHCPGAPGC